MSGEALYAALLAEISAEFPAFRIVKKAGDPLSRAIDTALFVVTLGGQREYLTQYRTVLGDTLYVPTAWEATDPVDRVICLRHERVHLRQRRRFTLAGMAALYLLVPLPLGLAYGRARLEWEAYEETLRATLELKGEAALLEPELRRALIARFTGPAYGWMWPFRAAVERWFDEAIARLVGEHAR